MEAGADARIARIEAQIERRRQRAEEELTRVANRGGHAVFSTFEVVSVSGRRYTVEIRSLAELHNSCTCPDYRTNLIGTCKHIEGVLLHLRREHGARLEKLAAKRPRGTQIYLHHGEEVTVRVALPLPARLRPLLERHFDAAGQLVGAPPRVLPAVLAALADLPPEERALARVEPAVEEHLELLRDREEVRQQRRWFLDQVEKGERSFRLLSTRLYPYQEEGALHLAFGRRALLADDMGLGKTIQALAAAVLLRELRGIERALIVCPASLKHQWAREVRRFTSLPAVVIEGNAAARRRLYREPAFFFAMNYELVRRDLEELEHLRPDLIILDEAQRIKNWRTKTATTVKRLRSRYAFVLTGTPLENRLDELYSLFQFIDPRVLGPLWRFNERFFDLEPRSGGSYRVLGYKNLDELRRIIAPVVLRRTRQQVLSDLPPRVENHFFVEMTAAQREPYEGFRETVAKLVTITKRRPLSPKERDILLKSLLKMRLICDALALHDKQIPPAEREKTAPKLAELEELLAEQVAGNGHKALVFSQWSGMLELTEPLLGRLGLGHVKLTGDVPSARRGQLIERFFEDPDCRVFLSTDAGGVGLNLQAASLVVNLDLPWNPAVLEQRIARAHRHGQPGSVQVVNLLTRGTIEEHMLDTLAAKRQVFAGVFEGDEEGPEEISFEDRGQALLRQLDEMLSPPAPPAKVELELAPAAPGPSPGGAPAAGAAPAPSLESFAERLLAALPRRLLLVREAPVGDGLLVVVDGPPGELRPRIEGLLAEHLAGRDLALHLMEREGYRAFAALMPAAAGARDLYRAPSLAPPAGAGDALRREAEAGLTTAERRLALARLVLEGGFAEEMLRPVEEALGWGLSSLLALRGKGEPSAEVPPPRLVQAELVEPGHLPAELAPRLAWARELAAPPTAGEPAPPPAPATAEALIAAVQDLLDLGRQRLVEVEL